MKENNDLIKIMKLLDSPITKRFEEPEKVEKFIPPEDFNKLGKYEQQMLYRFGEMLGIIANGDEITDFAVFKKILNKIIESKENPEKQYITGLLVPKNIKHAFYPSPFPTPAYTFKQDYSFTLAPNISGCFVLQFVSPYLPLKENRTKLLGETDDTYNARYNNDFTTDMFVCNHPGLNGVTAFDPQGDPAQIKVIKRSDSQIVDSLFSAYIMVAASVTVKYVGSERNKSGMLGASFDLSTKNFKQFDSNACEFDNIIRGNNYVEGDMDSPLTALFFPPDNSFIEYRKPGDDYISKNTSTFTHRINIFGRGLDVSNRSGDSVGDTFIIEVHIVYACIPQMAALDVLPTELLNIDEKIARKMLTKNKMAVRTGDISEIVDKINDYPFGIENVDTLDDLTNINKIRIRLGLK
jgi:hypothetical protein